MAPVTTTTTQASTTQAPTTTCPPPTNNEIFAKFEATLQNSQNITQLGVAQVISNLIDIQKLINEIEQSC